MRRLVRKQLSPSFPLLREAVQAYLLSLDGRVYSEKRLGKHHHDPMQAHHEEVLRGLKGAGPGTLLRGPSCDGCDCGAPVMDLCLVLATAYLSLYGLIMAT